ncbi:MAG: hypothetical protein KME20_04745 [Kaiparowitsia implicata GSE-PSE-MK54-09C]|jgi:uncharacterized membrane protein YqgA involved in biofilm formation|nr:hypothetical protein [Kaiparowitsia implicata GSE-PSE-MK54-09C]
MRIESAFFAMLMSAVAGGIFGIALGLNYVIERTQVLSSTTNPFTAAYIGAMLLHFLEGFLAVAISVAVMSALGFIVGMMLPKRVDHVRNALNRWL